MQSVIQQLDVHFIARNDPDRIRALHVALDADPPRAGSLARPVADLLAGEARGNFSMELVVGAYGGGRLISAAVAAEAPGGAAIVSSPTTAQSALEARATVATLRALVAAARERSIRLLESLLPAEAHHAAEVLRQAGFRHLTRLVYLSRAVRISDAGAPENRDIRWQEYTPTSEALFCEALDSTYVDSWDCPELNGVRPTTDVLAGHKATGVFDPSLWWVAMRGETPVGVLLLSGLASHPALEIVYVGVAQPARGTGVANALLQRATSAAAQKSAKMLTLAVDHRNAPARRLYRRWGFRQSLEREAWIANFTGTCT